MEKVLLIIESDFFILHVALHHCGLGFCKRNALARDERVVVDHIKVTCRSCTQGFVRSRQTERVCVIGEGTTGGLVQAYVGDRRGGVMMRRRYRAHDLDT